MKKEVVGEKGRIRTQSIDKEKKDGFDFDNILNFNEGAKQ